MAAAWTVLLVAAVAAVVDGRALREVDTAAELAKIIPANPQHYIKIKRKPEPEHDFLVQVNNAKRKGAPTKLRASLAQATARTETKTTTGGLFDDFLGFKSDKTDESDQSVIVTLDKTECNVGDTVAVYYQRMPTERHQMESTDWVGVFRAQDPTTLQPSHVSNVGTPAQTGMVPVECAKPGEMFVRMVRQTNPQATILGRAALRVWGPCQYVDCSGHGTCNRGECACEDGWEGDGCHKLTGNGLTLGWTGDQGGDFYIGGNDTITAKMTHSLTAAQGSGFDMVAIVDSKDNERYSTAIIPEGDDSVELVMPAEEGQYYLELVRGVDGEKLATSNPFEVHRPCPHKCSFNGQCVKGKCECSSGYDRDDCSRGPGMASVKVISVVDMTGNDKALDDKGFIISSYAISDTLTVEFQRNEEVPGLLTDEDWIGLFREEDVSCDHPQAFQFAVVKRVYDPDVAPLDRKTMTGTVQLQLPSDPANYVVRYVRSDHARYAETTPTIVAYPLCEPFNCNNHGTCTEGKCVCDEGWQGDACDEGSGPYRLARPAGAPSDYLDGSNITVAFERPTGLSTRYDLIGLYGKESKNNSHLLYGYAYATTPDGDEGDGPSVVAQTTIYTPGATGEMTIRYIDAYTLETKVSGDGLDIAIWPQCQPHECYGHGTCDLSTHGDCHCDVGWELEPDCSKEEGEIKITVSESGKLELKSYELGFNVKVVRPSGHFNAGDKVEMYPKEGAQTDRERVAFAYATHTDEMDYFLMVPHSNLEMLAQTPDKDYIVKYVNSAGEEMGSSPPFVVAVEGGFQQ